MAGLQKVDISTNTIFRAVLVLLGFYALYLTWDIVFMLFGAFIVASAVEPAVDKLQRLRVPRAAGALGVYAVVILVLVGFVGLLAQPIAEQSKQLAIAIPGLVDRANGYLALLPEFDKQQVVTQAQSILLSVGDNLGSVGADVFAGTRVFISGVVSFVIMFVIAFYLVVEQNSIRKLAGFLLPDEYLPRVEKAIDKARRKVGKWVVAQLILGLSVGSIVAIGLWLLGVPYALLLGLIAGLFELIPVVGPMLSVIPGVLVAVSQSWSLAALALGFYLIVGQVENHILVPNIMRKAVGIKPAITIIALLVGARLAGFTGVLLAVPITTVLAVVVSDVIKKD